MTRALMVQGTTSYCGKSFLVMALCRIFADRGYRVTPFKAQNTSLNSFVTQDGGEIARAQALQALAAGIEPRVEMNPILIKPKGDRRAQIVVNGVPYRDVKAREYYEEFAIKEGIDTIKDAFNCIKKDYDLIIIEGAGSPAEINLYESDIANMRTAGIAGAPVILVADIDRGGVFASIYGTINLLQEEHRRRVKGIVINKFRGDIDILNPGIKAIEEMVGTPVLGVIPYIQDLKLPGEDSLSLEAMPQKAGSSDLDIAVIRLPRISNFTDFDPLMYDGAAVRFVDRPEELGSPGALIIPGTKNTIEDLLWLRDNGFEEEIKALHGKIPVIGICGGYQMLGKRIVDEISEGAYREIDGLALLDVETRFGEYKKTTRQVRGRIVVSDGVFRGIHGREVYGYEIHMGETLVGSGVKHVFDLGGRYDGAVSMDGMTFGTYIHGIFDSPSFRVGFLRFISGNSNSRSRDAGDTWMESIKKAASVVSENIDIRSIEGFLNV